MRKDKTKEVENNLTQTEAPVNSEQNEVIENDTLESRFEQFSKQTAEFSPEQPNEGTVINNEQIGEQPQNNESEITRGLKIKMFVGFACFVLAGFGTWLLNMLKNTKVPVDKMYFTKEEKESLEPYMDDPRIIEFIDKLPTWVIAVGHISILISNKHDIYASEYKIVKPKKIDKKGEVKK